MFDDLPPRWGVNHELARLLVVLRARVTCSLSFIISRPNDGIPSMMETYASRTYSKRLRAEDL